METTARARTVRPFLTAAWRHLVMANFQVDPAALAPFVPSGTSVDTHDGIVYASIVAFRFLRTRVLGIPIPFHRDFEEINLRFYVRREHADGVRRGVVFVKEVVPRRAIALVARTVYNEPYVARPTRSRIEESVNGNSGRYEYGWKLASGWATLAASVQGAPALPAPQSVEAFISEHYWGYNSDRSGSTREYRVAHPQWRVWQATESAFHCDVAALYGHEFTPFLSRTPVNVFVADGSAVEVYAGARLEEASTA